MSDSEEIIKGAAIAAAVITGGASLFGTLPAGWTATEFFLANMAINAGAQAIGQELADQQQPQTTMKGRNVMFRSTDAPRQVIYGKTVVSGPLVYLASSGEDNKYLHLVIPLAGHEIDAVESVFFNEEPASVLDIFEGDSTTRVEQLDPSAEASITVGGVLYTAPNVQALADQLNAVPGIRADYAEFNGIGYILLDTPNGPTEVVNITPGGSIKTINDNTLPYRVNVHLGGADQLADTDLISEITEWTSEHRLRGVAYIYVRLKFDPDVWPNGVPNISALVRGKKVFNPSTSITAYSANWALCVNDYLRYLYGLNCTESEIDQAQLIDAAQVSDQDVEYQPGLLHKRYEINGSFYLSGTPMDILGALVGAGAGVAVYQMGQWRIFPGAPTLPESVGLGIDDLRDPIRFQSHAARQGLFNAVRGTFVNKDDFNQVTDFPIVTNATFEAEDGGTRISNDISLPFTNDVYAAQRIATVHLIEHRNATIIQWPSKITGLRYAVWDVIPVTVPQLGWTNKLFRLVDFKMDGIAGPDLILKAYDPNAWDHDASSVAEYISPPVSSLPSPRQVLAPTNLKLYSGTDQLVRGKDGTIISQIRADWYRRDGLALEDEVQYKESAAQTWITAGKTREQELLIGPVSDATLYDVRVRTINTLGVKSDWLEDTFHFVTGKAEVPSDPAGLAITVLPDGTRRLLVTAAKPLDFGGYIFRARAGSHATWDSLSVANGGIDLHTDPITSQPWDTSQPASGDYTFGVKMVDTSGNESANAYISEFSLGPNASEIQVLAALTATWDQVTGTGKPEDYATATEMANLVLNGRANRGSNLNWSGANYRADEGINSGPCFHTSGVTVISDEFIPVSEYESYSMTAAIKSSVANAQVFAGVACFAANKTNIDMWESWRDTDKNTTLFEAVSATDTTVKIVPPAESWFSTSTPFSYIQWDIQADFSDLPQLQAVKILTIDESTAGSGYWLLTLDGQAGVDYPLGTPVGNSTSGAIYAYALSQGAHNTTEWVTLSSSLVPHADKSVMPAANEIRAGTRYFRVVWLPNRGVTPGDAWLDSVSLLQQPEKALDTKNVNGVAASLVQANAQNAITAVSNMASDLVFSAQEKRLWQIQWPGMSNNFDEIYEQAIGYGIHTEQVFIDFTTAKDTLFFFLNNIHGAFNPTVADSTLVDTSLVDYTADFYTHMALCANRLSEYIDPGQVSKFLVVKESLQQGVSYPGWQSIHSIDLHGQAISSVARTIRVAVTINIDVEHGISLNDTIFSMGLRYRPTAVDPTALQREWKDISLHGFEKTVSISYEFDVYYDPAIVDSHFINLDCQVYTTGHTIFFNDRDVTASFHFV